MAAPKGNQYTRKWSLEDYQKAMDSALEVATTDDQCFTVYAAVKDTGIPYSTLKKACEDYEVLAPIKKDIMDIIANRIASGAIQGKNAPAPSIFMLKNLGFSDKQEIKHTGDSDEPITFKGFGFKRLSD